MAVSTLLQVYRRSPPQEGSLQLTALRELYPPARFKAFLEDPSPVLPPDLEGVYPLIMPQKERILAVRDRFLNELKEAYQAEIVQDRRSKERFKFGGAFAEEMLSELYEHGVCLLSRYAYHQDSYKALDEFAKKWFEKVAKDFETGDPRSFSAMAKWFHNQRLSSRLSYNPLAGRPQIQALKKLAHLGVKTAENALIWAYYYNSFGEGTEFKIQLNLSPKERLDGLWDLVKKGSARAFEDLCRLYQFELKPPAEEVKKIADLLIEHEVGLTHSISDYYYRDPLRIYSLAERVELLTDRARRGEMQACAVLWDFYAFQSKENWKPTPDLSPQQREEKLKSLETAANQEAIQKVKASWILNPFMNRTHRCPWTIQEKLQLLENLNCESLADYYQTNQLQGQSIGLSLEERLDKLIKIARSGSIKALRYLIGYYMDTDFGPLYQNGPNSQELRAPEDQFNRFESVRLLAEIALEGGSDTIYMFTQQLRHSYPELFNRLQPLSQFIQTLAELSYDPS